MPYVEKPKQFEAWRTDGTEANAREIIKKAYAGTFYASKQTGLIRWISMGPGQSYFTVVVMVKNESQPTIEVETEPGDYVIRDEDKRLHVLSASEFHRRFEEVEA